jgi:diguanylate cyclase (GGDEF)-like protein
VDRKELDVVVSAIPNAALPSPSPTPLPSPAPSSLPAADKTARANPAIPVVALATAIIAVAAGLTVAILRGDWANPPLHAPWIAFAVAFAVVEWFPVHIEHRRETLSISLSNIPLVVGLFTVGPAGLLAARVIGSGAALAVRRRQGPLKLSVNLSSFWLETAAALWIFHALHPSSVVEPAAWGAALTAAVVGDTVLTATIIAAISLFQRRWEPDISWSSLVGTVAAAVDTCLALVVVTLYRYQPAADGLMAVVLVMVVISYQVHRRFRDEHRRVEHLYRFSTQLGDAVLRDRVLPTLLEQGGELMHAERAWAYVCTPAGLVRVAADTVPGGAVGSERDGIVTAYVPRDTPEHAMHLAAHERGIAALCECLAPDGQRLPGIAVPLIGTSGPIGTLVVAERSGEVRSFRDEDLQVFTTIANHAAVAIENADLVDQLREQAAEASFQSRHDALTGLPNRELFTEQLARSLGTGTPLAVLLLDLDRFKEVNDTLGHHNGDTLLQQVGVRLRSALRHGDSVARLGGDEFGILLTDIGGEAAAVQVARGVVAVLEQSFPVADVAVDVGASVGITLSPDHGLDADTLLRRADVAMYAAKADQTDVALYRPERDDYSPERLSLVSELRHAIQNGELEVHYQPQVELGSLRTVGAEALVRWQHPTRGMVMPDEFIGIAESTGLIRPLTQLVLGQALAQSAAWRDAGFDIRMSVNLSARSLLQPTLVEDVAGLLATSGVAGDRLCLELTESSIMTDVRRSLPVFDRLRGLGVTIAVDDFGTGHSSLAYLKRLPVGELKIDKSFVLPMTATGGDEAIVRTICSLAQNLGLPVVAEGVEDEATAELLVAMGCRVAQGFAYSPALPPLEMQAWLATGATISL